MKKIVFILIVISVATKLTAQDLHFSQYFNSPMLLNPANTGMLQDANWRAGINYRNQATTIPVPYNTFSIFSDFTLFQNKWDNAWIGTGFAAWRDVAGNGDLALTKIQGNLAAHVLTGDYTNFSAGLGFAYNQRSVDFSKLTYDVQWDEFTFNKNVSNQENFTIQKTTFTDLNAGVNFSYYNNDNIFFKVSIAASHLTQPVETFYGQSNKIGIRPIANAELVYKANDNIILSPSVYYTRQKKASELVGGTTLGINASGNTLSNLGNEIVIGFFYRNKDAVIGMAGYKWKRNQFLFSYDHTVSQLGVANKGLGAMEVSLIIQGNYRSNEERTRVYGCPRF
ncbi:MAG: PorP/SprF family type IX secretion system membrane protein [Chitinophagaceae bacterium]|nr:MAG: bacteroidetes-specific membrane protein [Bacteroidetes bacterium OLB11]MCC6447333.1 PorP/SprF family type IX secretion system membrane protein [Chitinophagaceae bacterium]HMN32682.1 PorP/SprF family type IX secretion system membrane protein [Chitinophagaceae bacterium]